MELIWQTEFGIAQAERLARSYRQFTGRELVASEGGNLARAIEEAPFVIVSHGIEADPVLNFGNAAALKLWEMSWEEFTRTPSRLTAEAPDRAERERLLAQVHAHGFIDHYNGVRISKNGRRFRIAGATVWNVFDSTGVRSGQAASFRQWEWL